MRGRFAFAVGYGALVLSLATLARADQQSDLERGRNAYLARQYDEADARLRALLDPKTGTLHDPVLVNQARMLWGAVMIALRRNQEASALFEKILTDDPTYEPDPLSYPTQVLDAFTDTRAKIRSKLNAVAEESARRAAERRAREAAERERQVAYVAQLEKIASQERTVRKNSRLVALVPFGAGQFQNGQPHLGWVFLASEVAFVVGGAVTLPIYLAELQSGTDAYAQNDDFRAREYLDRANVVRAINLAFYTGFAATAVLGVLQAQLNFVPEVVEVTKRELPKMRPLSPMITPLGGPENRTTGLALGLRGMF